MIEKGDSLFKFLSPQVISIVEKTSAQEKRNRNLQGEPLFNLMEIISNKAQWEKKIH